MVYRTRRKYSASDKAVLWDLWERGASLKAIGRWHRMPEKEARLHAAGIRQAGYQIRFSTLI